MKVDSNSLGCNIHWCCLDCGQKALRLPENKNKKPFSVSTIHQAVCDVCKKVAPVTETRDFGFPIFEI